MRQRGGEQPDRLECLTSFADQSVGARLGAVDPEHRDYPNITEREKLQMLASVREKLRTQKLAELELKRVARDADEVKALIAENLARRPKAPAKP